MNDLNDLYQEVILDHGRNPRNKQVLPDCNHQADGYNPLCGDKVRIYLKINNGIIEDITFSGEGCAISMASASLMCERLHGMQITEAMQLFCNFHNALITDDNLPSYDFGKLVALFGVKQYPMRVKCATLAWHTMNNALSDNSDIAQTE